MDVTAVTKGPSALSSAAEELAKASCSHVQSPSLSLTRETVDGLKTLSVSSSVEKSVINLKGSLDSKIHTLSQNIAELNAEMVVERNFWKSFEESETGAGTLQCVHQLSQALYQTLFAVSG
jgi:hypothetical protein